jgi:uncharacterized membrane protein YjjB (DUF3815 family)
LIIPLVLLPAIFLLVPGAYAFTRRRRRRREDDRSAPERI